MDAKRLKELLAGKCTEEELINVFRWLEREAFSGEGVDSAFRLWNNIPREEDPARREKVSSLLDRIHHLLNLEHNPVLKKKTELRIADKLVRVAASMLLPVLGILLYLLTARSPEYFVRTDYTSDTLAVAAPAGVQSLVKLADGSRVFLNHGSSIRYPVSFSGKHREVILSGEGYFQIAHDPERPFSVRAGKLRVEALGTSFNIMAYPDEDIVETTLVEGRVLVKSTGGKGILKPIGILYPNQHLSYNANTSQYSRTEEDIEKYVAWKEGKLIFRNESIIHIAGKLSRWYNVEFEFKDHESMAYTYTATFKGETLSHILELLAMATPIRYEIMPRDRLADGTFLKQRIIIEKIQ
ncbi:MAG: FecR family protein [Mangrovibacterium sp.]